MSKETAVLIASGILIVVAFCGILWATRPKPQWHMRMTVHDENYRLIGDVDGYEFLSVPIPKENYGRPLFVSFTATIEESRK